MPGLCIYAAKPTHSVCVFWIHRPSPFKGLRMFWRKSSSHYGLPLGQLPNTRLKLTAPPLIRADDCGLSVC